MSETIVDRKPTTIRTVPSPGEFDAVRDRLFDQFQDPPFEPESGHSGAELQDEVEKFLKAHIDMPKVLQKANAFRIVVTRGRICVDPNDWFADKLDEGGVLRRLQARWLDEAVAGPLSESSAWLHRAYEAGYAKGPKAGLDLGHIAPGWQELLETGLEGLIDRACAARDVVDQSGLEFLEAVEMTYTAAIAFSKRLADEAERLSTIVGTSSTVSRLSTVADACRQVPAQPPRTFHEALQFTWIIHQLIEMEGEWVRSMGHFDRTLYPYYAADIEAGRLDRDTAKELIKFYWMRWYSRTRGEHNGKNFLFGGQYRDGTPVENELTYVALEAYREFDAPDPKLSVRFLPATGDRLYRVVADLIRSGLNSFVLINDVPAVEALLPMGKSLEDARAYLPIGCYEPAVEGMEAACTMNITVNLAKPVELMLNEGVDPRTGECLGPATGDPRGWKNFDDVWNAYRIQLEYFLSGAVDAIAAAERQWPEINPSPMIAGTIHDCIEHGRDVGQGGPRYNSVGFVGAGLADAADSLAALKQALFEDHRFTMEEMLEAVCSDFDGRENMRRYLLESCPKWGNDNGVADALGKQVADLFCDTVHGFRNGRGGRCQAALFTLTFAWEAGLKTGALPGGRMAGTSLAPGTGAAYGRDLAGATGLLNSVSKLDAKCMPNGSVLDVTLHPTAVEGNAGLDAMESLIRTYFQAGGYALQFNIYDADLLREAQRDPEKHANLQIRLTGWSVYFASLTKFEQDQFIARISHKM